jgi:hypothetical protein
VRNVGESCIRAIDEEKEEDGEQTSSCSIGID